jgi:hypothetical protein
MPKSRIIQCLSLSDILALFAIECPAAIGHSDTPEDLASKLAESCPFIQDVAGLTSRRKSKSSELLAALF